MCHTSYHKEQEFVNQGLPCFAEQVLFSMYGVQLHLVALVAVGMLGMKPVAEAANWAQCI